MKIELNGAAGSQAASETVARVNNTGTPSTQGATEDTITFHSASIQSLTNQALETPEVRQATVQSLRQTINNGEYNVNTQQTASAIVSNQ